MEQSEQNGCRSRSSAVGLCIGSLVKTAWRNESTKAETLILRGGSESNVAILNMAAIGSKSAHGGA